MRWTIEFTHQSKTDLDYLSRNEKMSVLKALQKVSENPLPYTEGGYGKPLGHKAGTNLTGCFKIKIKTLGIRIVYRLIRDDNIMQIVVIGARSDNEVYSIAQKRLK